MPLEIQVAEESGIQQLGAGGIERRDEGVLGEPPPVLLPPITAPLVVGKQDWNV